MGRQSKTRHRVRPASNHNGRHNDEASTIASGLWCVVIASTTLGWVAPAQAGLVLTAAPCYTYQHCVVDRKAVSTAEASLSSSVYKAQSSYGGFGYGWADARGGLPPSTALGELFTPLEHDVVRGFAYAEAWASLELPNPYTGVGGSGLVGSSASAEVSFPSLWAIANPPLSSTIPIKIGFPYRVEGALDGEHAQWTAGVSGEFYANGTLLYAFSLGLSSFAAPNLAIDYAPASFFDTEGEKVQAFAYQPGKPKSQYETLSFDAPPGVYEFKLGVGAAAYVGVAPGETGELTNISVVMDPFISVDPDWEYADLVSVSVPYTQRYDGNPLAGTSAAEFWAEYSQAAPAPPIPEPATLWLAVAGLLALRPLVVARRL